ncbi:MAG: thioredoxin family protein [Sphingomonadaceae bacterium]|nr:thioredoxin family protein [Sphingomonadaceae bacterium]
MSFVRLFALLLALVAAPVAAQLGGGAQHLHPALVAESQAPAPGKPVTLAIAMNPDAGWHGYWQNPGDAGTATQADWTLPVGINAGPLQYPVPTTLLLSGLMNYVYEAPYALLVRLDLPAGLKPGAALPIGVRLSYLACTTSICVPENATIALRLTVGTGAPGADAARFGGWRAALPRPLGAAAHFMMTGGKLRLAIPFPVGAAVHDAYFFPLTDGVGDYAAPERITRNGDRLIVEMKAPANAAPPASVEGVLRIAPGSGVALSATAGAVPATGAPLAHDGDGEGGGGKAAGTGRRALIAFAGALLGGLLLNLMPCVFPILSLKALSLARARGEGARGEAVAYAAGVILVCVALGAVLLGLRSAGHAVGWAFQLQDPRVTAVLLLLVTGLALNLAGLFELGALSGGGALAARGGVAGAFWTGALAAFVATPCTGPFMGAALGAALVLPAAAALAVFAGLGLGLALPFVAIGFSARLRRLMPKPGAWMETLRHILAVPMLVTALGLAWVLGRQAGANGMALGLAGALLLALGLWWTGGRQRRALGRAWAPALPSGLVAVAVAIAMPSPPAAVAANAPAGALAAEPFSETRLATLRAQGRPVFVYFTADWCLTCKVNEKAAIERSEVAAAFRAHNVATLVGDWTDGDAAIGHVLEAHGRAGVPLYLFYPASGPEQTLPQVLTPGGLAALAG